MLKRIAGVTDLVTNHELPFCSFTPHGMPARKGNTNSLIMVGVLAAADESKPIRLHLAHIGRHHAFADHLLVAILVLMRAVGALGHGD